ncbi:MAG: KH domain-containing protein [Patescibacteria group bacterium]|nr:KH domain-containing protein [Patescibacteria group bacterium]
MAERDQEFLEFVVKGLVEHPDSVKISRVVDEMGVLLTLDLHPEDMGKVIGRSGNTAKAIRTLLRVVGMKNNARVNLKINEPEGGMKSQDTGWDGSHEAPATPQMKSLDEAMGELGNI